MLSSAVGRRTYVKFFEKKLVCFINGSLLLWHIILQ